VKWSGKGVREINKKSKSNETENKALPNLAPWRPYLATKPQRRWNGQARNRSQMNRTLNQHFLPPTKIIIWTTCQIEALFMGNLYSAPFQEWMTYESEKKKATSATRCLTKASQKLNQKRKRRRAEKLQVKNLLHFFEF